MTRKWSHVSLLTLAVVGCGGIVRFSSSDGDGGGGATAGSGADPQSVATATSEQASTTSVEVSSSTGIVDPCLGQACGADCAVCNDVECLPGLCDEQGSCALTPPPCAIEVLCYIPDEPCAALEQAGFELCSSCGGLKGCTFIGTVLAGPFTENGSCCYEVAGECVPNP